ncbi:MAG: sel1 repeat family protein [Candidatus Thiodiazotropha sp. (ex Monitilora ramsayi)]|nr:sel1 repeat family protein [Candidatus Thiodiazotropha sp. (ex Monitilora ramsayi)]
MSLFRSSLFLVLVLSIPFSSTVYADPYEDAVTALADGEYRQAYRGFKRLAQRDHIESQYQVGMLYIFGQGVEQNMEKGISWLEQAAYNGVYLAANELAQIYISGRGVEPNEEKAMKWVELATKIAEENEEAADDGCD